MELGGDVASVSSRCLLRAVFVAFSFCPFFSVAVLLSQFASFLLDWAPTSMAEHNLITYQQ